MIEEFIIFKKFSNFQQANKLRELLTLNNIDSEIANNAPYADMSFSGNTTQTLYEIRIKKSAFGVAEDLLTKEAEKLLIEIDKDYYLFEFTNEELYEILLKPDEWNIFDFTLAQKILKDRDKPIDKDLLTTLKNERLKDLAKPEGSQKSWIAVGYIFAFLGGFLGLIIGYMLWTSKKNLPNGEKIYTYSENDRQQGRYIFIIGVVILPLMFYLRTFG